MLKRAASLILTDGGVALTLINGGQAGPTSRGWVRRRASGAPQAPIPPSLDIKLAPATNVDLGLQEFSTQVERADA